MTRIGLLTYCWSCNPGTFLQALGTLRTIRNAFPNASVELVPYQSPNDPRRRVIRNRVLLQPWQTYRRWQISRSRLRKYLAERSLFLGLHKPELRSEDYAIATEFLMTRGYDFLIVGSDTLLELSHNYHAHSQPPIYWLPSQLPARTAALSSSAGSLRYDMLTSDSKVQLRQAVEAMSFVSVRDDMTYQLLAQLQPKNLHSIRVTPDPTFALDIPSSHFEQYALKHGITIGGPMVGIDLPDSMGLCRELTVYYRDRGFTVVSPRYNPYATHSLGLSPLEWAGMHRFLSLYVTPHFHGIIFSLKHGTPVLSIDYDRRRYDATGMSKTYSLLLLFGLAQTNHVNFTKVSDTMTFVRKADEVIASWNRSNVLEQCHLLGQQYRAAVATLRDAFAIGT